MQSWFLQRTFDTFLTDNYTPLTNITSFVVQSILQFPYISCRRNITAFNISTDYSALFVSEISDLCIRVIHLRPQLLHTSPPNACRQHVVSVVLQERQCLPPVEVEASIGIVALKYFEGWLRVERTQKFVSELLGVEGYDSKPLSELAFEDVDLSWHAIFELIGDRDGAISDLFWPLGRTLQGTVMWLWGRVDGVWWSLVEIEVLDRLSVGCSCWLWKIILRQSSLQMSFIIIVSKYWSAKGTPSGELESIDVGTMKDWRLLCLSTIDAGLVKLL